MVNARSLPTPKQRHFNLGQQTLPSGRNVYPVAPGNRFYKTLGQITPEIWADFSDRGLPEAHPENAGAPLDPLGTAVSSTQGGPFRVRQYGHHAKKAIAGGSAPSRPTDQSDARTVLYVGFAEWDMDGRLHTIGEMDRLMMVAAQSKYPCARPATFEEYSTGQIRGIPEANHSGRDVVFVGPGSAQMPPHQHTLGSQKYVVPARDSFDCTATTTATYGRKCCLCVYPAARVERQHSLSQFGFARSVQSGAQAKLRRTQSWSGLSPDRTKWAAMDFAGSSPEAQRLVRYDRFFYK